MLRKSLDYYIIVRVKIYCFYFESQEFSKYRSDYLYFNLNTWIRKGVF